jgi:hypothetical protein
MRKNFSRRKQDISDGIYLGREELNSFVDNLLSTLLSLFKPKLLQVVAGLLAFLDPLNFTFYI